MKKTEIIKLFEEGKRPFEIAKMVNTQYSYVSAVIREYKKDKIINSLNR